MDCIIYLSFMFIILCQPTNGLLRMENHPSNIFEVNDTSVETSKVLSRRKRFLTFPDGSSFQLVFCVQTSALIPIGDIFLYGNTAALAWSLPKDPDIFHMFKDHEKYAQRRGDTKTEIYYVDEAGKLLAKVPYSRKPTINPAFAKRSVDETNMSYKDKLKIKLHRMKMHKKQLDREFLKKEHMNVKTIGFHRNSRVGLYEKIEKLLQALGRDGRQCVLRKLCESATHSPRQGTFLQELFTVVFTLPKGDEFEHENHKEYDKAHSTANDCASKYPGCENFGIPINL